MRAFKTGKQVVDNFLLILFTWLNVWSRFHSELAKQAVYTCRYAQKVEGNNNETVRISRLSITDTPVTYRNKSRPISLGLQR